MVDSNNTGKVTQVSGSTLEWQSAEARRPELYHGMDVECVEPAT